MRGPDMLTNFALSLTFLNILARDQRAPIAASVARSKLITLLDNSAKSLPSHNIKSLPDASKQFLQ
jgi:hypothetical protein